MLRQRLEQQLEELEILRSVFSEPGEFQPDNPTVFDHATAYVRAMTDEAPGRLACTLHLDVDVSPGIDEHDEEASVANIRCSADIQIRLSQRYKVIFALLAIVAYGS